MQESDDIETGNVRDSEAARNECIFMPNDQSDHLALVNISTTMTAQQQATESQTSVCNTAQYV